MKGCSIITTSYNRACYIEETIKSIVKQDYPIEHIIVDNNSTDETSLIVKKYPQVKFLQYPCKQTRALNIGLKVAKYDYIGWINSDDYYVDDVDVVKTACEYLSLNPDVGMVYGLTQVVDGQGKKTGVVGAVVDHIDYENLYKNNYKICQPSTFYSKKALLDLNGWNEKWDYVQDKEIYLRIIKGDYKIKHINKFFATYRAHNGSISVTQKGRVVQKKEYAEMRRWFKEARFKYNEGSLSKVTEV